MSLFKNKTFIAVSVMCQSYMLSFDLKKNVFEIHCIIRKTKRQIFFHLLKKFILLFSINCTAIEFIKYNKQFGVACGLNTGCIEIYIFNIENFLTILPQNVQVINFHYGLPIQYLKWNIIQKEGQEKNLKSYFLLAGCESGKFAWYKF